MDDATPQTDLADTAVGPPVDPTPPEPPRLDAEVTARLTYASMQNAVPLLRALTLHGGAAGLPAGHLTLAVHPGFAAGRTWPTPAVPPGGEIAISEREVKLAGPYFDALDEAERGTLTLAAEFGEAHPPLRTAHDIDLLARDEWGGIGEMGQLLAAFVQPGDRSVARILRAASDALRARVLPDGLDGYRSADPRRVWSIAAAIWSAIEGMGLRYAVPPASFERQGQKIRTPARIGAEGLATCLDTTLLVCAALEAAGLHPVVVFTEGHAFAGVWLTKRTFDAAETREVTDLRKAIVARDLLVFETTRLTAGHTGTFLGAQTEAEATLSEAREHEFQMAVDVARCRSSGIRPLPRMAGTGAEAEAPAAAVPDASPADLLPPDGFEVPEAPEAIAPASPQGRIDRWQRKLLDLSLRNRLLNFKDTRASVPLRCDDTPTLEDMLSEGTSFRMISLPDENPRGGRDPAQYLRETGEDIDARLVRDALTRRELCSPLTGADLRAQLTNLYRKARGDLSEGGTNTLFLAVGFLRWKPAETDRKTYRAPLLLLPVTLRRASAASPFTLIHQGDEVRFNLTLLEKLAEQGIEAPDLKGELPRDAAGLDVPRIFARMRSLIRDVPGFEVTEELALSTFSFAKYLMWKDLVERTGELRRNPLVAHLINTPSEAFVPEGTPGLPGDHGIDRRIAPDATFMPLPADASQTAAVVAAAEGRDMIVIGPPGTGKSQTIANLIAHCLAHGKTILFVAEKSAALDVVHRRLSQYGLGDAVLELHSSKAEKKGVVAQLGRAWTRDADGGAVRDWAVLSSELGLERERLNDYVDALHRVHANGLTVFRAVGRAGTDPGLTLAWPSMDAHDAETLADLRRLAGELGETAPRVRDPGGLTLVTRPEAGWSNAWVAELSRARDDLAATLPPLLAARGAFAAEAGAGDAALAEAFTDERPDDRAAMADLPADRIVTAARALERTVAALTGAEAALSAPYADRDLAKVPVARLDADLRRASASLWPLSVFRRSAVRRELATYAGGKPDPVGDLPLIEEIQTHFAEIGRSALAGLPGWSGRATDTASLTAAAARVAATDSALRDAGLPERAPTAADRLAARTLLDAERVTAIPLDAFARIAGNRPGPADQSLSDALADLHGALPRLQDWLLWQSLAAQADARGLAPVAEALQAGRIADAPAAFDAAHARWWAPLAIDAAEPLRTFIGWKHDARIAAFRDLDARHQAMSASQIRHRIAHGLPGPENVAANSALGRLRNLMGQTRPRESIRSMLAHLGPDVTRLAPCVLMSPLSIAQYLPTEAATFDIVLFDEASQITTWDAIGAIARGRQSVIVGDPKQMPPSRNFDGTAEDDEDLAYFERDQASILDEAVAAGVPQALLNVHYRSRDEGLIAFSNHRYYDGRLVTFPAPRAWGEAVRLHRTGGTYERGGSRTNPGEARAVAAFTADRLKRWLSLPEDARPTLGIVTFNLQQQQLILDHLDRARTADPELEWFFGDERQEPVIVKNLENIQGDERDVMIFSTTFGRDAAGKLSMNFGPMNQDGGQKRLNVAVSRAREEMHVFSSLEAADIDVTRTRAQGVRDLRDFLDYAARGPEALAAADTGSTGGVDSPFEAEVRAALEALGWEVRTQIGVSGYRLDLGVVHPDHAGRYLAGIECDGASYHSSPTARDRDRMRQAVLEGLGWKIERIWSTEWFRTRRTVLERIDAALRAHLDAAREAQPSLSPAVLPEATVASLPVPVPSGRVVPEDPPADTATVSPHAARGPQSATPHPDPDPDPDGFFEPSYTPRLRAMIDGIVAADGPIHLDAVARRIAALHGWSRVGGRIRARVDEGAAGPDRTIEPSGTFLWHGHPEPVLPWRGLLGRDAGEIPVAEIAGLLRENGRIAESGDAVQTLARELGLSRLRAGRRTELEGLLDAAKARLTAP